MRKIVPLAILVAIAGCSSPPPPPPPAPVFVARPKPVFPPPSPTPICAKPAEKVAFAVAALRMQLSVIEITCDAREQFNSFTVKFRNDIAGQNKAVGAFFSRAYGSKGVANQDQYETAQINQMSAAGQYYGADFCKTSAPMFGDVLTLKDGKALADYAVAQNFDQVLAVEECAPPPAKTPAPTPAKAPAAKKS
jgi:hypothetical protein